MPTTAALLAAILLGAAAPGPPPAAADLSVDLTSPTSTILLPGARFDLSVTNHGPDPLASATVVVRFGADAAPAEGTPCAFDATTDTLTCAVGALPAGDTATISATVYFLISGPPRRFSNTATATAATPPDPDSANDSDSEDCYFQGSWFPPPPFPTLIC